MATCTLSFEALVDYRFDRVSEDEAARIEDHLFECPRCAKRARFLIALGDSVDELAASGALSLGVTRALLAGAAAHGLVLREYRIAPGESVACTAAPDDDYVAVRLALDGQACERVDVDTQVTFLESQDQKSMALADVVIDRAHGEVVYLFSGSYVRSLPRSRWVMHALLRTAAGERRLGPYVMEHTPWSALPATDA